MGRSGISKRLCLGIVAALFISGCTMPRTTGSTTQKFKLLEEHCSTVTLGNFQRAVYQKFEDDKLRFVIRFPKVKSELQQCPRDDYKLNGLL